jgi:hypothetical protein
MKKYIFNLMIATVLILTACDSIEKRNELEPAMSTDQLKSYMSVAVSGNNVVCKTSSKVPRSIIYWSTSVGGTKNDSTSFYFPFKNKYTISLIAYGGDEKVIATQNIEIAENDPEYFHDPMWNSLTDGSAGKTWVWADDNPYGSKWFWGNGSQASDTYPTWWGRNKDDYTQETPAISLNDEMTFDLNGNSNFTKMEGGVKSTGTFDIDTLDSNSSSKLGKGVLKIKGGSSILKGISQNDAKKAVATFDIIKLTDDELILLYRTEKEPNRTDWNEGWYWLFKRKGYTYPAAK